MAKQSGSVRASKWPRQNPAGVFSDMYSQNGVRVEYGQLTSAEKRIVKDAKKKLVKDMFDKLKDVTTKQVIDNGVQIEIKYTKKGLDHFANDAMLHLSGKYFSEASMMRVNEILEKSTYVPGPHGLTHSRNDGRVLWFTYSDSDGRGVFFKVNYNKNLKGYELYSVVD